MKLPAILAGLALTFLGSFAVTYFHIEHVNDPLAKLERQTRRVVYAASGHRAQPGNEAYWDALQMVSTVNVVLGIEATFVDDPGFGGALGVTNRATRTIILRNDLSWNERLGVLAHEAGHVLQPASLDRVESEAFAEGVAYLVCRGFGRDDVWFHANYLAQYKTGLHTLRDYRREIEWAARLLLGQ